ncbi:MAG: UDP-glucose 4-epimerase GalE [Thermoleophilia bacterium]|jgi:UDP-glucose 4-epimerase
MNLLATGGAGYIGAITTRLLLDAGHQVTVLDTLENGHENAVDPRATLVVGSVGDAEVLDRVLPGIDAVMHLAGYIEVAESQQYPGRYFQNNVAAPLVMLEAMVRHGVHALVFSSTAAVYGEPEIVPIPEDARLLPVNAYGASKLMFEQMLDWYDRIHGLRSVRFRYFNVAGAWPGGEVGEAHDPETHIIPRILQAMVVGKTQFEVYGSDYPTPDGTCVRDYIHVLDLAEAHRLGLEWVGRGGESAVFNLGNGRGYSNLEVVRTCAEVTGREVDIMLGPRRPGDPAVLIASGSRAAKVLGWRPQRDDLRQMVRDAWEWYRGRMGSWGRST